MSLCKINTLRSEEADDDASLAKGLVHIERRLRSEHLQQHKIGLRWHGAQPRHLQVEMTKNEVKI